MKLAAQVLHAIHEASVDREAKHRYMSLPTLRKPPYDPYTHEEWDAMSKKLTDKWASKYKTAINVSDIHFEMERANEKEIQLPIVERMIDLALQEKKTGGKIVNINQTYSKVQARFGKTYDAANPRSGRDFAKRGGLDIHSLSMGIWLLGTITGELPSWATEDCRQTWKFLTCSDKKNFHAYQGDEIVQVERNQGLMRVVIEIE